MELSVYVFYVFEYLLNVTLALIESKTTLLTSMYPPLAQAMCVKYHSITFGAQIPTLSLGFKPSFLKPAANLSDNVKTSLKVSLVLFSLNIIAGLLSNLVAACSRIFPIVKAFKGDFPGLFT